MAWSITPTAAATLGAAALNDRRFVDQFWYATAERLQAVGNVAPFPQAHEYDSFVITGISDGGSTFTLTASAKNWGTAPDWWGVGVAPGIGYAPDWAASTFDVLIDADRSGAGLSEPDPRSVIQGVITANTATTLTVSFNLSRFIKKRGITSVASLVGRHGWIVRHDGSPWTRGLIRWPNALHHAYGLVAASPAPAAGTHASDLALQHAAVLVGKEVLYLDGTGELQRGTVTAVSGQALTYTGTTAPAVAGQPWYVVDAGGYWDWGREGGPVQAAHGGLTTNYYTHAVGDDDVTTVGLPRLTYPVLYGADPLFCPVSATDVTIRDVDYYIPYDNVCAAGDIYVQPKFWQSWRGLWAGLLGICSFYVKPITYDGAAAIPNFTPATWLNHAGVNGRTGTAGTHTGTTMPLALSVPHAPINLWWTITDADGNELLSGYTDAYDGSTITGAFGPTHDGKPVVASIGPTRYCARAFDTMTPVTYFVPDVNAGAAVTPPSNTFPGTWSIIPAATHCLVSDKDGYVGRSTLARHAIADGHIARYVGHRIHDPGFPIRLPADTADPTAPYHNYGTVTRRQPAVQRAINASLTGTATVTEASGLRLTDTTKDWGAVDFYPAFNGLVHSGTFTSGGTQNATDSTKAGSPLWAASRFPGFTAPLYGFTVEILMSGSSFSDPGAVIAKRWICDSNPATGFLRFDDFGASSLPASASGKQYRIREPYRLNRWAGLKVHFRNTDGDEATTDILANDGDTLFLQDPGISIQAGTTYEILAPTIGDVYKRVSGAWVSTSGMGADSRYGGSTFRDDAAANLEDLYVEYGLPLPTDVTFATVKGPQELYDAINVLTDIKGGAGTWHGYADDGSPEYNHNASDTELSVSRGSLHTLGGHTDTLSRDMVEDSYAAALPGTQVASPGAPFTVNNHQVDEEFALGLQCEKQYAYLEVAAYEDLPPFFPISYTTTAYVYATINGAIPGPDEGQTDVLGGDGLSDRSEYVFDTSWGMEFRKWKSVGSSGRVKVGGSLAAPPAWGTSVDESQINSVDHPSAPLRTWAVFTGAKAAATTHVYRMGFKFK